MRRTPANHVHIRQSPIPSSVHPSVHPRHDGDQQTFEITDYKRQILLIYMALYETDAISQTYPSCNVHLGIV